MALSYGQDENWEKDAIEKLLQENVREQRRARRWSNLFKFLFLAYLVGVSWAAFNKEPHKMIMAKQDHSATVDIRGVIDSKEEASAQNVVEALTQAFDAEHSKGIILRINSPGGSPYQSREIYNTIRRLRADNEDKKVYAVIEDIGTSAAYLIASAADEIYADETSRVGSIGVLINGFGFVDTLEKLGIDRRLYHAGKHKGFLDPFSPRKSDEDDLIQIQLDVVHEAFIKNVRDGRGDRLKENADLFSGLSWTGMQAKEYGLIDGFGNARYVAEELIKAKSMIDYSHTASVLEKLTERFASGAVSALLKYKLVTQFF